MIHVCYDMGKLHNGTQSTQPQQGKILIGTVLLKAPCKTKHHKDATIFRYVNCVPLSFFNVLTEPFSVWKVNGANKKGSIFD